MRGLVDRDGDTFHCTVDSIEGGSVICLRNEKTGDEWVCCVTYENINQFWTLRSAKMLRGLPCVAVGIMQYILHDKITSSNDSRSVSLIYKHSPYYMELQVKFLLSNSTIGIPVQWSFPMVPKAIGDIEKQVAAKALEKSA